ncbi:MAG TPA: ATP-binding protein, partial [Anaerolineae bacterium]
VSTEIPNFQAQLQNLLMLYNDDDTLLNDDTTESEKSLQQLFRINPLFRRIIVVGEDQDISAFYPADVDSVALTEPEQTAVARVLTTSTPDIAPATTREDEQVLSFIVPVLDEDGTPQAALVGRVPRLSIENLIVGLQGTVGKGTGFIVDENGYVIAHPDTVYLLSHWAPPEENVRHIRTVETEPGVAYQSWQGQRDGRELVYYVTEATHPWTVVITVPYEVVLSLALSIGAPLLLVLVLVTAAFYTNLMVLGRDITGPIADLVAASKTMAAGGNWTPSIHDQRDDEIGQLSQAFVQMQQSIKKRLNELSLLLGVSHDVSTVIDLNQGMPAILRGALRGTGAAGARAVVLNPSGGYPLTYGEGPAADAMAILDRPIMTRLRHASELMLATPNQIRAALELDKDIAPPLPSLLAIPLHSHDRFQGILWLGYRQPHSFDLTERNLLRTLASQAAVLVENAHLFATAEGGRRRLAAVLASTSDAVIVTDPTERILLINRSAEKMFDLDASHVSGRPVASVIRVKDLVDALTGPDEIVRNLEIPTGDGKTYYASVSTIISNEGRIYGRVAVLHDITHLKEIDDMKSEFVATVSHDLRSPLTFMRGYTTMLPMIGELNEKQQDYTDKILAGIDQMAQLVDDLLDLGRIEAGVDLAHEEIEIQSLLSDIATEYWQHAHLNGIKLQVEVASEVSTITGDMALIRQAVANLVGNAIKYAPNSGQMTLRAEQANGEVVISVKDNGPGIPQRDQMRLFEKFYRVKQRGTEKVKGSGLGLAIVKSIVERHGGRAWCHSQRGQGATFYISLPLPGNNGNK